MGNYFHIGLDLSVQVMGIIEGLAFIPPSIYMEENIWVAEVNIGTGKLL